MSTWQTAFNKLSKAINSATDGYTNYGGCGVVAAAVGRVLERNGFKVSIIVQGYDDLEHIKQNLSAEWHDLQDWHAAGLTAFYHGRVMFEKDGETYVYDTDDDVMTMAQLQNHTTLCKGVLTVEEVEKLADAEYGWNSQFPRSTIPTIYELTDKLLAEVLP
jgi:glycogen synthase